MCLYGVWTVWTHTICAFIYMSRCLILYASVAINFSPYYFGLYSNASQSMQIYSTEMSSPTFNILQSLLQPRSLYLIIHVCISPCASYTPDYGQNIPPLKWSHFTTILLRSTSAIQHLLDYAGKAEHQLIRSNQWLIVLPFY